MDKSHRLKLISKELPGPIFYKGCFYKDLKLSKKRLRLCMAMLYRILVRATRFLEADLKCEVMWVVSTFTQQVKQKLHNEPSGLFYLQVAIFSVSMIVGIGIPLNKL